jgi:hypothetical protein
MGTVSSIVEFLHEVYPIKESARNNANKVFIRSGSEKVITVKNISTKISNIGYFQLFQDGCFYDFLSSVICGAHQIGES